MKPRFGVILILALAVRTASAAEKSAEPVRYRVQLDVISEGYDGKTCWFHPRAGEIPGATPTIVLTLQKLNLKRSDVFYPINSCESADLGKTWSPLVEHTQTLGRHPVGDHLEEGICDFTPKWHAASGRLLATRSHGVLLERRARDHTAAAHRLVGL